MKRALAGPAIVATLLAGSWWWWASNWAHEPEAALPPSRDDVMPSALRPPVASPPVPSAPRRTVPEEMRVHAERVTHAPPRCVPGPDGGWVLTLTYLASFPVLTRRFEGLTRREVERPVPIPSPIAKLDGELVMVEGFMKVLVVQDGLVKPSDVDGRPIGFWLSRYDVHWDNQGWSRNEPNDSILVDFDPGLAIAYTEDIVVVVGRLSVGWNLDGDGNWLGLLHLTATRVEPVP